MSNIYGNPNGAPVGQSSTSTNLHAYPPPASGMDKRQIGPVTTAASGGVAVAGILTWLIEEFTNVDVPDQVQTYMGIVLVILAGWAIKPRGKRVAE